MMGFDVDFNYNYQPRQCEIVFNKETVDSFYNEKQKVYECKDDETIFIIVRHGENESNVAGTYDGRTLNLPLTEKGYAQGELAGKKLRNKFKHIDHVITTPMIRTHQTAMKILEVFPLLNQSKFTEDSGLLERYVGKYEGGSLKALEPANKKDKIISASKELSFEEKMKFSPEEGIESFASIWARAYKSLQQAHSELKGQIVLAVTHSGTIRSIYWHLTQELGFFVPYGNFKPDNGAYMIVSIKNGEMTLLETDDINIIP